MRFELSHTHAYPGCRVRTEPAEPADREGDAVVELGDGNVLAGRYALDANDVALSIPAHRTARGTPIVAKRWRLRRIGQSEWKILGRPFGE